MNWAYELTEGARADLKKLATSEQRRIVRFLADRVAGPADPRRLAKSLQGSGMAGLWRFRVGHYRLIGSIEQHRVTVRIIRIGHRSDIYD